MDIVNRFWDYSSFIPSSMSFLLTVGFLKVGNQPITGNAKKGRTPVIYRLQGDLWAFIPSPFSFACFFFHLFCSFLFPFATAQAYPPLQTIPQGIRG